MKKLLAILLLFGCALSVMSQASDSMRENTACDSLPIGRELPDSAAILPLRPYRLPFLMAAPGLDGCNPWLYGTYSPSWRLHEGLNAQLSMSLTAGFGKGAPSGVGFGQSASVAYALPIGKKCSLAAGIYAQNFDWGPLHRTDVGIAAAFGYHVNERISLYAYATKSFLPKNDFLPTPGHLWWDWQLRDRIGAMAEFKIGKNAAVQVSIEHSSSPSRMPLPPAPPSRNDFMTRP